MGTIRTTILHPVRVCWVVPIFDEGSESRLDCRITQIFRNILNFIFNHFFTN